MRNFRFASDADVAEDVRSKNGFEGGLLNLFAGRNGVPVHRWHHMRELIDNMHPKYHVGALYHPGLKANHTGMHVHGSIAVIEKEPMHRPVYSRVN